MSEFHGMEVLNLQEVSMSFRSRKSAFNNGTHHVLRNITLSLYHGETLGVIGRNGAGKTSMLRIMAGIIAPTSGNVITQPGLTTSLLTIGLGFRGDLTGRDNAMLSAMLLGATRKKAQNFMEEIKEFSELGDSFEEPEKTYSAGMRLRLGFTTALMTEVDILLVDEVLSVGDARFRAKAKAAMEQRMRSDQTVVFVSHNPDQVRELCNRVIWIEDGQIKAQGGTVEVLAQYHEHITL